MKLLLYVALFFLGYTSALQAQTSAAYPQWQHPVLQQLRSGSKILSPFYNKDSTRFITLSVIDNKQKIIYWFDCYGYYFDAVSITGKNIQAISKKNVTPFKYYNLVTAAYLKVITKARRNLQTNGAVAKFTAYERQLLQIDDSLKFPSTLKKLIELDKQKLSVERQIREFYSINPQKIKCDSVFAKSLALSYGSMQTTWEQDDTTTIYFNRIALEPVYKAVLNHSNAAIDYFNRGNQLIDQLPINKDKISRLFIEKTDVFLLYRGWLEMKRYNLIESITDLKASENEFIKVNKNIATFNAVNTKSSFQSLLTRTNKLLQIADYKIDYLTTIDRGFVSQCLRDQYQQASNSPFAEAALTSTFSRGNKFYELTDARGNVMAVVTDKKIQHSSNGTTIDYYEPDILSATDYAPFGSSLPGRDYQSDKYRYGYNGKENDNDIKGKGNQQDYGMRIYDPRLGRFLSVDPLGGKYPWYTPYQFAGNTPIQATDLDGAEEYHYTMTLNKQGKTALTLNSTKYYNEAAWWHPALKINTERYVVNYENKNYYIGFAGSYGRGNENGAELFKEFKKNPVAPLFPLMFLNENQSNSVEQFSMAVLMQNNTAMYGPLTSKAWYTANQETHNFRFPNAKRHIASKINQSSVAKEINTVALATVDFVSDANLINTGNAAKIGNEFHINGRIYGEHDGILYPISGKGLYKLDRGSFKALGILNEFGDTEKAGSIFKNMKLTKESIKSA